MLKSCLHAKNVAVYSSAAVAGLDTLKFSQGLYKLQIPVTRLQTRQRPIVTSTMSAGHDVVSDEYKPNFKKQNQEFLGTVFIFSGTPRAASHNYLLTNRHGLASGREDGPSPRFWV